MKTDIQKRLFALRDGDYKLFHQKLIPTVDPDTVIGVRMPEMRRLARVMYGTAEAETFIKSLPHTYYEENNLHGLIIEREKNYPELIARLDEFLPYVDNWATCDFISPPAFKKHRPELYEKTREWMSSEHTYAVRFGIGALMSHFLDEDFTADAPERVAEIKSEEYYIRMMQAWYFATALAKQYDAILPFIENRRLEKRTHNKAIQKARESRRISPERKEYLNGLKLR